jgi:hypothetical protein
LLFRVPKQNSRFFFGKTNSHPEQVTFSRTK